MDSVAAHTLADAAAQVLVDDKEPEWLGGAWNNPSAIF